MHITPLQWRATDWIRQGKTYPRDFPWHIAEARSVTSVVLKIPWGLAVVVYFPFFMQDGNSGRNFGKWP